MFGAGRVAALDSGGVSPYPARTRPGNLPGNMPSILRGWMGGKRAPRDLGDLAFEATKTSGLGMRAAGYLARWWAVSRPGSEWWEDRLS